MRGARLWLVRAAALLLLVPLLGAAPAAKGSGTDTAAHRGFVASMISKITGGEVQVAGLSGSFPDRITIRHLELHDAQGIWAVAEKVNLTWSPLHLVLREVLVDQLNIAGLHIFRQPVSSSSSKSSSSSWFVSVVVNKLHVNRLEADQPVAGAQLVLGLDGSAHLQGTTQGTVKLTAHGFNRPGTYALDATLDPKAITLDAKVQEPAGGPVAKIARLPDLGALDLHLKMQGPRTAEATALALAAGPLRADAHGTLDLTGSSADMDVSLNAPAMQPRPDLAWQSLSLQAHVHGSFSAPQASGKLHLAGLQAGGAAVRSMNADLHGNAGEVALRSVLEGVRIPGPNPDLLANAPLTLSADARLKQPDRPITFSIEHPLIAVKGRAQTKGTIQAAVQVSLPHLAPFAAIAKANLHGHTTLSVKATKTAQGIAMTADGQLGITGGMSPLPGLIGPDGRIAAAATLDGGNITISNAEIDGRTLRARVHGTDNEGAFDIAYAADLTDLSVLTPRASGALSLQGQVQGTRQNLALQAKLQGQVATAGYPRGPIEATIEAHGLPTNPTGRIQARGMLDGAPLRLDASAQRSPDGTLQAEIAQASWRSAQAEGHFTLAPGTRIPLGQMQLRMTRLADLKPLIGRDITGSIAARLALTESGGHREAALTADLRNAGIPGTRVGRATLTAHVADPLTAPVVQAKLAAQGIDASKVSGASATVTVAGPEKALKVDLSARAPALAGHPATLSGAALVDAADRVVTLQRLRADWHGVPARLLAPARIALRPGIRIDHLRLGVERAVLEVNGQASPSLDLNVALRNVTAATLHPFAPTLHATGSLDARAHLTGTLSRPTGTVRVAARGLKMQTGPGAGLPPARLTVALDLAGTAAKVNALLSVGTTHLALAGTAPLSRTGSMDLRASGAVNLALTDPILTPIGRRLGGVATLNLTVAGTLAAPRLGGSLRLAHGTVEDYAQGVHITNLSATVLGEGETLRLASLSGRAGAGTIGASGTIGVLAPEMPVDLRLTAHNARLLASNLVTATVDAGLSVRGTLRRQVMLGGTIRILEADVTVPSHLPVSVASLKVIRPGQSQTTIPAPPLTIGFDLTVEAPGRIFVRGHGLDAELAGRLHIGGTATHLRPTGGFHLRYGRFSIAGKTLNFTTGRVSFEGSPPSGKIDPAIDFQASSASNGITATIGITGFASSPKFSLSSTPQLPPDQILSQLLFGESISQLSPFQLAEIAQTLAELTGTGGGFNPLDAIRSGLGLDRLNIGTNAQGQTTLEAGRYVAPGIYVGAVQGTSGTGETQAQVQIDLTKHLKLNTAAGSGPGANSVGLSYQLNY